MTAEQLRNARDAVPFRPFSIRMADGRAFRVIHRDYISISPSGRTVVVYLNDEAFNVLDLLLMTELSVDPVPASSGAA